MGDQYILQTYGIGKSFSEISVLQDINLGFEAGKVHALLGENGAGKSTLIKILSGVYQSSEGYFVFEGQRISHLTPSEAIKKGIAVVHQELNLVPEMTVTENIFLGRELIGKLNKVNIRRMNEEAEYLFKTFEIHFNVRSKVKTLSVAEQQMVEIVKAVSLNAKLLILDEPTDVLTDKETELLFKLIHKLKAEGKAIIYISHRLDELKKICDVFTVLRDGRHIFTGMVQGKTKDEIVQMMVARKVTQQYPRIEVPRGDEVMRIENFGARKKFKDINFSAYSGEILGFYGLVGSGRTELMRSILGADKKASGRVILNDKEHRISSPNEALNAGIVYITENRKELGILLGMSVGFNTTLSSLEKYLALFKRIDSKKEDEATNKMVDKLAIKTTSIKQEIRKLSGGNQQKVLLARSMLTGPKVLIFDEPTRGVDVGAKVSIYEILNDLKRQGVAIVIVSSDMPEILGISDRLMVMHNGKLMAEFQKHEIVESEVADSAFGKTRLVNK